MKFAFFRPNDVGETVRSGTDQGTSKFILLAVVEF